jgi:hypothetical protein
MAVEVRGQRALPSRSRASLSYSFLGATRPANTRKSAASTATSPTNDHDRDDELLLLGDELVEAGLEVVAVV